MGKKKKKDKEETKPWCYYCDRIFDNEATLIQHQKAKHFRCGECNRKLNTAQGLAVHSYQVHKVSVDAVPGAKPGREAMDIEIFGMAGVPAGLKPGGVYEPPAKKAKVADAPAAPSALPGPLSGPPSYPIAPVAPPLAAPLSQPPMPQYMGGPSAPGPAPFPGGYMPYPQHAGYPGAPPPPYQNAPMLPPQYPRPGMPMGPPHPGMHMQGMGVPGPYGAPRFPHPMAPLFPVTDPGMRPPAGPLFPIGPTAHAEPTPAPNQSVQPFTDAHLVWADEEYSVEERRAQNPMYMNSAHPTNQ